MADVPIIVGIKGALSGTRIEVPEEGVLKIGRADDNDIVIVDDDVSRFHAELLYDNGTLWLQDAGSRNGVFVNSNRVTGHKALRVGDAIAIADHEFEVRWDEPDTEPSEVMTGKRRWFWPFR